MSPDMLDEQGATREWATADEKAPSAPRAHHRIVHGDGTSTYIDCEDFQRYVEDASWMSRAEALAAEAKHLQNICSCLRFELEMKEKTSQRNNEYLIAERDEERVHRVAAEEALQEAQTAITDFLGQEKTMRKVMAQRDAAERALNELKETLRRTEAQNQRLRCSSFLSRAQRAESENAELRSEVKRLRLAIATTKFAEMLGMTADASPPVLSAWLAMVDPSLVEEGETR